MDKQTLEIRADYYLQKALKEKDKEEKRLFYIRSWAIYSYAGNRVLADMCEKLLETTNLTKAGARFYVKGLGEKLKHTLAICDQVDAIFKKKTES